MEHELSTLLTFLLLLAGFISGFINTIAGGGSMLTLPTLMMLGMPADVANATNRIGVLMQSLTGVKGFSDQKKLDKRAILPVLALTATGALVGTLLASVLPVFMLKPMLLGSMVAMGLLMVVRPQSVIAPIGTQPHNLKERPGASLGLFLSGVYGGFVQAGVGFILIAALAGGLRYDLTRTNALKILCTGAFSAVGLVVFTLQGLVWWIPGLMLAVGSILGAIVGVRFSINVDQNRLKWCLFVMVIITCAGAVFF
jgi:uncharacterized membrane protein YfcA